MVFYVTEILKKSKFSYMRLIVIADEKNCFAHQSVALTGILLTEQRSPYTKIYTERAKIADYRTATQNYGHAKVVNGAV